MDSGSDSEGAPEELTAVQVRLPPLRSRAQPPRASRLRFSTLRPRIQLKKTVYRRVHELLVDFTLWAVHLVGQARILDGLGT